MKDIIKELENQILKIKKESNHDNLDDYERTDKEIEDLEFNKQLIKTILGYSEFDIKLIGSIFLLIPFKQRLSEYEVRAVKDIFYYNFDFLCYRELNFVVENIMGIKEVIISKQACIYIPVERIGIEKGDEIYQEIDWYLNYILLKIIEDNIKIEKK